MNLSRGILTRRDHSAHRSIKESEFKMYTQQERAFKVTDSYEVSQRVGKKVLSLDSQSGIPSRINTSDQREQLIDFLSQKPNSYLKKIGLRIADTKDVHDVTYGRQKIGDFYFCDMLSDLYRFQKGEHILDFGCSSGRVIRNLNSVFDIKAYGCDPRKSSIEFNLENFEKINWFVSNEQPPLANDTNLKEIRFNMVFAISVWSHFSEEMALKWFEEFSTRVVSGGRLIFSTHGTRSIYHFETVLKKMPHKRAEERLEYLRAGKLHFMPYPKGGDLDNQHWGMTFLPKKWIEENLSEAWKIEAFHPGLAMKNQDVYVLVKR